MYVARHVVDVSVFQTMLGKGPITPARHYGLTVGIWALTLILAMSTKNLGSVLEIFGAFGASVSVCPSHGGLWCAFWTTLVLFYCWFSRSDIRVTSGRVPETCAYVLRGTAVFASVLTVPCTSYSI